MRSPVKSHAGARSVGTHPYRGRKAMKAAGLHRTKSINAKTNAAMQASSAPTPRHQPTAGQLIGAGIIKGN